MIIQKIINQSKLMDELLEAGLITALRPEGTPSLQGNELYIENEDNVPQIQAVIEAHDPTPLPQPLTETETLRQELNEVTLLLGDLLLGGA